jgi:hypothetical protein
VNCDDGVALYSYSEHARNIFTIRNIFRLGWPTEDVAEPSKNSTRMDDLVQLIVSFFSLSLGFGPVFMFWPIAMDDLSDRVDRTDWRDPAANLHHRQYTSIFFSDDQPKASWSTQHKP